MQEVNQSDIWEIVVDMRAHKPFQLCMAKEDEMKMEIQIYDGSAALTQADKLFIQAFSVHQVECYIIEDGIHE